MPGAPKVRGKRPIKIAVKIQRGVKSEDLVEKIEAALQPLSTDMLEADEAIVVISREGAMPPRPKPPRPKPPKKKK
jgi:hypothetical protein